MGRFGIKFNKNQKFKFLKYYVKIKIKIDATSK